MVLDKRCLLLQVYGIEWCPHGVTAGSPGQFVSFGKKHIKLWTCTTGQWSSKQLSVARLPMQHVHCAAWLSETLVVAGMSDGQLYIFKVGVLGSPCCIAHHTP